MSYEQAEQSQRCDAIPSLMTAITSWVTIVCSYKISIVGTLVFIGQSIAPGNLLAEP